MACIIVFLENTQGVMWVELENEAKKLYKVAVGMHVIGQPQPEKGVIQPQQHLDFWKSVRSLKPKAIWVSDPRGSHESILLEVFLQEDVEVTENPIIGKMAKHAQLLPKSTTPHKKNGMSFQLLETAKLHGVEDDPDWLNLDKLIKEKE